MYDHAPLCLDRRYQQQPTGKPVTRACVELRTGRTDKQCIEEQNLHPAEHTVLPPCQRIYR